MKKAVEEFINVGFFATKLAVYVKMQIHERRNIRVSLLSSPNASEEKRRRRLRNHVLFRAEI